MAGVLISSGKGLEASEMLNFSAHREAVQGLGAVKIGYVCFFFFSIKLILATINPDTRQIYKTDFLSQNLCTHITLSAYSHDYSFHKNEKWFCIDWLLIVRFPAYFM